MSMDDVQPPPARAVLTSRQLGESVAPYLVAAIAEGRVSRALVELHMNTGSCRELGRVLHNLTRTGLHADPDSVPQHVLDAQEALLPVNESSHARQVRTGLVIAYWRAVSDDEPEPESERERP